MAKRNVTLLKHAASLFQCKRLKIASLGMMVKVVKKNAASFKYLEEVRQHLSRLPSIDPNTRTLLLCGFPNVGKSSFINKVQGVFGGALVGCRDLVNVYGFFLGGGEEGVFMGVGWCFCCLVLLP